MGRDNKKGEVGQIRDSSDSEAGRGEGKGVLESGKRKKEGSPEGVGACGSETEGAGEVEEEALADLANNRLDGPIRTGRGSKVSKKTNLVY
jgi:hypothetical protein